MVSFIQANFVTLLGAIVAGTVVWAVVSSLVPKRKQKMTVSVSMPETDPLPARRAMTARG